MQRVKKVFIGSVKASLKIRRLIFLVAAIYFISYIVGHLMIQYQVPYIVKLIAVIVQGVSVNPVFVPIVGALKGGNLALAIAYTFLVNLSSGAFASTTLPGVIPILGGVGSIAVTGFRGFIIGAIFNYADVFNVSLGYTILTVGTLILELGAYVFSGAAGINISLAPIFPSKYNVDSRWTAFKEAWKDTGRIYIIVIILLALGAIWEMSGIFVTMP